MINLHIIIREKVKYIFLISSSILLISCGGTEKDFEKKIINYIVQDNQISFDEYKNLEQYIKKNDKWFKKNVPGIYKGDEINKDFLENYIVETARKKGKNKPAIVCLQDNETTGKIDIYMENSGSMDGYINNDSTYKHVLGEVISRSKVMYGQDNISFNIINTSIYPVENIKLEEIAPKLNPSIAYYNSGNRFTSEINDLFRQILDRITQDNVSILITDSIYSSNSPIAVDGLTHQKNLLMEHIATKLKTNHFDVLVVKFNSNFKGIYYDRLNGKKTIDAGRPFYLWIFGKPERILLFAETVHLKDMKGFNNIHLFSLKGDNSNLYYSILLSTNKSGHFRRDRDYSMDDECGQNYVHGIMDVKSESKKITFCMAVDLRNYMNYHSEQITADMFKTNYDYSIDVLKYSETEIDKNDLPMLQGITVTHLITMSVPLKFKAKELLITIPKTIPQWIIDSSSNDDINIQQDIERTFGLEYIAKGILEGFAMNQAYNRNYVTMKINIRR